MNATKYFFSLVFLAFFTSNTVVALHRDYQAEEYCSLHQKPSFLHSLIDRYIPLIPDSSGACLHVECPKEKYLLNLPMFNTMLCKKNTLGIK